MTATAAESLELPQGYQSHRCVDPSLHHPGFPLFSWEQKSFSRTAALFLPYTTLLPSTSGCNHVAARCRLRPSNPMRCRAFGHGAGSCRPTFRKPRLTPAPKSPFSGPARWPSPDRSITCRSWPASQTLRPIPRKPKFAKTGSATPANLLKLLGPRTPREAPPAQIFANLPAAHATSAICETPARVSP